MTLQRPRWSLLPSLRVATNGAARPACCATCGVVRDRVRGCHTELELQEVNSEWVMGAYLRPQCTHPGGGIDPLLPHADFALHFLNRVRTEKGFMFKGASCTPPCAYVRSSLPETEASLGVYLCISTADVSHPLPRRQWPASSVR